MKKLLSFLIGLFFILFTTYVSAIDISEDTKLIVGGNNIGIRLDTNVKVMGLYGIRDDNEIYTPWKNSNIKEGDLIVGFNDYKITTKDTLFSAIKNSFGKESTIKVKRNNNEYESKITPYKKGDTYNLGLYIKDNIMGTGTLTYILPEYNIYGALGHQITDEDYYGGEIYEARVEKIIKPRQNQAGEKRAIITSDAIGNIEKNEITGIHGTINNYNPSDLHLMNIGKRSDCKLGKAQILTSIKKDEVVFYDVEIKELKPQKNKDIKGIKFEVTDERLIEASGGIVQGMSGSPIIQNEKIIGAVTHVLIKNPKEAYGIYIEFMLEEMDIHIVG